MRHVISTLALTLAILFTPTQATANTYDNQLIDEIEINISSDTSGGTQNTGTIRARMKTREGDLFSQTDFDNDLKTLIQDYDKIEPSVDLINGKIYITLNVWEKPYIRSITWEGNEKISTKDLQKELGLSKEKRFDRQEFTLAFHKVKAYYVKQGFFETELEYSVDVDPATNEMELVIMIDEGRAGRIKKIQFHGLNKTEETEITEMMATRPYNFFLSWLTGSGSYGEDMIQHDTFQIINYLQNHGYADADVMIDVIEAPEPKRIIIDVTVERGELYSFGEVTFEGNTKFDDQVIRNAIGIRKGDPFSPEKLNKASRSLMDSYGKRGYIESLINYEPRREGDNNVYAVKFSISEGEQYRIGLVKVFGNTCTNSRVILHESLIIPGELFNVEKLFLTETKLRNVGYFKNVNVYGVNSDESCPLPGNYRDVHIEVEECGTGQIGGSLGFSTSEHIFGSLNITERNFNICGFKRLYKDGFRALRGNGEYAHATVTVGQKSNSYVLSWTKPYFLDTPWSVGIDLEHTNTEYISKKYEIKASGLTLHATHQCNPFIRVGAHYRFRYSDIRLDDDDASDKLQEEANNCGIISAIGYSWTYDSTNSPIKPTCGLKSRVESEFAGVGGHHTFLSCAYLNCWYYDLWGQAILRLRADARFIQPLFNMDYSDLPLDERFFMGGDNQLRGYRPYRVGPRFGSDEPRGGISLQLVSAEICRPIFSRMDAFIFFDAGHNSKDRWNIGPFYYSTGFGAKLQILGDGPPLTVGMGYPLNPERKGDVKKFFMMVGGKF